MEKVRTQLDIRADELQAAAEADYNDGEYGEAYDEYLELAAIMGERGEEVNPKIYFRIARCLEEIGDCEQALEFLTSYIELAKDEPLIVSEAYFQRGLIKSGRVSLFDGLIDFDLAIEHIAGEFSPRHRDIGRPLTHTLVRISAARQETLRKLVFGEGSLD